MKKKFERIKDKMQFYRDVAEVFGSNPESVRTNWFNKKLYKIPQREGLLEALEDFIDRTLITEKEFEQTRKLLRKKYLGL